MATRIIGHRGAAGLALENSTDSIRAALTYNMDGIEFDVRRTSDGRLVVLHDRHTGRIAAEKLYASRHTLAELQALKLSNGERISSLEDVLDIIGDQMRVTIDIKSLGSTDEILRVLEKYPQVKADFTSLHHHELSKLKAALPKSRTYLLEHTNPFEIVRHAYALGADGISLNMWIMNPLTYFMARRHGIDLRVYTVNNPILVRFFRLFYPKVSIYTDHPERYTRKKRKK
jgi:glycerophosphoryl diester phosphodiesterase